MFTNDHAIYYIEYCTVTSGKALVSMSSLDIVLHNSVKPSAGLLYSFVELFHLHTVC